MSLREAELAVAALMQQQVRAERLQPLGLFTGMFAATLTVVGVAALLALGAMIHAVLRPNRGWVDVLAGTHLVPR